MKLLGRTAVVTGGANGIGAAIVRRFHAEGAHVAVVDFQEADIASLRTADGPGDVRAWHCDVTDGESVERVSGEILEAFGTVGILVNNAGGSGKEMARHIEDNSDAIWHYVMDLNVTSVVRFCRMFLPGMRSAGFGRIINMSSAARHGTNGPFPTMKSHIAYGTAKAAMATLTKLTAKDVAASGITSNAIAPGMILPGAEARITKIIMDQPEEFHKRLLGAIPAGRYGNGEDIAAVAAFLASDEAEYVNGETIDVRGGAG